MNINNNEKDIDEELILKELEKMGSPKDKSVNEQKTQSNSNVVPYRPLTTEEKKEQEKRIKNRIHDDLDRSNPYKKESNVKLSEGLYNYRWIETELLKKLMKSGLNGSEWSVLFYILHRTRGYCNKNRFYKHTEDISIEEIQEYTKLSVPTIYKTLKNLSNKKLVYEVKKGRTYKIGINYYYDTWEVN